MNKFSLNLRGAMEAHQTSNLGVQSSSLCEDVFYYLFIWMKYYNCQIILKIIKSNNTLGKHFIFKA